jgi:glycerol-3-phosphate acyltransferase PlsY
MSSCPNAIGLFNYNYAIMLFAALLLLAFLCGSLPFSLWVGQLFSHRDVRRYGDGNPGAANAFRAGGRLVGLAALLLDISKAAAPLGLAYYTLGLRGLPVFFIAAAPLLGHIFSPFLRFRGGKALAVALGVWIGLTLWKLSLPAVLLILFWIALISPVGWALMLTLAGMLLILLAWLPDTLFIAVLCSQVVLLAWTHRADLRQRPHLRRWLLPRPRRAKD